MKAKYNLLLFCLITCTGIFFTTLLDAGAGITPQCDRKTLQSILALHLHFDPPYDIVSSDSRQGLCEVIIRKNNQLVPVYTNGSWVIIGDFVVNKELVTLRKIEKLEHKIVLKNISRMEQCVNFSYTPQNALTDESLFMFFDPSCFACQNIKPNLEYIADRYKLPIKVIVCPVNGFTKSVFCWLGDDVTFDIFTKDCTPLPDSVSDDQKQKAQRAIELFETLDMKGLPAFVFKSTGANISTSSADNLERFILDNLMQAERKKSSKEM